MTNTHRFTLPLAALLLACGSEPAAPPVVTAPTATVAPIPAAPTPTIAAAEPIARPVGAYDGVYLAVIDVGWVRLDATGGWSIVAAGAWNGPRRTPDGGWLVRDMGRIHRSGADPIGGPPGLALSDAAAAPDGSLWATAGGRHAHWQSGAWTVADADASAFFHRVAVDGAGTVWLGTTGAGLFRIVADRAAPVSAPGVTAIRSLTIDPTGRLVVIHEGGVVARDGEGWATLATGNITSADVRADGALARVATDGLAVTIAGVARPIALAALGAPDAAVRSAGWDGDGRLWIDTEVGVVVLAPSVDRLERWYPRGTVAALDTAAGIDVLGIGAAPVLPPAADPVGVVRGRITRGGAPVAGAWIELCEHPRARFDPIDGSPCLAAERPDLPSARTGADGSFQILDVPDAVLTAAIDVADGEWVIREIACCTEPDHAQDLGTIEVP